jgi:hypothetical protein
LCLAGYAVRQGLAIAMEHNFMMSQQGMENFRRQLMQLCCLRKAQTE